MLALAGYPLGINFRFFDPNSGAPVGQLGELIAAPYEDEQALLRFVKDVDVVTYEFESVPLAAASFVAERVRMHPPLRSLEISQDRRREKEMFTRLGIPAAPMREVGSAADLAAAVGAVKYPAIAKTTTLGYDGKGQIALNGAADLAAAEQMLAKGPMIVEERVAFKRELSLLAVRGSSGAAAFYPLTENEHDDGILRVSRAPVNDLQLLGKAVEYAGAILTDLNHVGALALEMFERDGQLLANEIAPRVHNSGHWTIEGAATSQFENHLRAILSLPLGSTTPIGSSVMVNLLGPPPALEDVMRMEGAHVHMYGKAATERRKVGHVTFVGATMEEAMQSAGVLLAMMGERVSAA